MKRRSAASRLLPFLLVALASVTPRASGASSVTVPDDFATLQGAIDGSSADTIFVKAGEYAEDVVLHRKVCLLAYQSSAAYIPYFDLPAVRSLHLYSKDGGSTVPLVWVRGLRFRGAVTFINNAFGTPRVVFEMCRMDSGFTATPSPSTFATLQVRGCLVFGGGFANLYYPDIVENAFVGGGLIVSGNGNVVIRGNYIQGPGDVGLTVCCSDGQPVASDNIVTGFRVGIHINDGGHYLGNTVTNCAGNGIEVAHYITGSTTLSNNIVRNCGANGIQVLPGVSGCWVAGNTVDSVGAVGIRGESGATPIVRANIVRATGSDGIRLASGVAAASNVVLWARGDGIAGTADVDSNVVGRCTGAGIRSSGGEVKLNTIYLTASSGIVLSGGSGAQVQRNLVYGSLGYGLDASGATAPVLACNDWYANSLGATLGVSPAGTDLAVNPQFCNLAADDVTLASNSPLLAAPGCGLIGARGLGCTSPASVEAPALSRQGLTAGPVPASGSIRFRWGGGVTASTLEVFDVQGARRFHADLPRGVSEFVWNAADDAGLTLPAGVYFVRRVAGARSEATRVVIQR